MHDQFYSFISVGRYFDNYVDRKSTPEWFNSLIMNKITDCVTVDVVCEPNAGLFTFSSMRVEHAST